MTTTASITKRHDFVLLFDVVDGNPNGDPDAGNMPRIDAETGFGLVTDVCLKRKVRNFVGIAREEQPPYEIYVKERAVLNNQHKRAYLAIGAGDLIDASPAPETATEGANTDAPEAKDAKGKKVKAQPKRVGGEQVDKARQWMCQNFFDVRTFGAVMSTKTNAGQVRGPVQLTFARSVDRITALEHSITRMAVTTEAEAEEQGGDNRTMGRKFTVPYGLYVAHGFVSAHLAKQTGFSDADLDLLWQALINMFELDRAAARGTMSTRGLYVFEHESSLGNAPAHVLFDRVKPKLLDGVAVPRAFTDYAIHIDDAPLPAGVTMHRKV